jgi:RNA polymerase sigma-70 factor, ECF subfamily
VDLSTEKVLLSRAQQGDYAAFDELVAPMRVWLFRLCYGIVKDEDLAEHTALVALERAWWAIGKCEVAFRPWLYSITRNLALGIIDKSDYRRSVPLTVEVEFSDSANAREPFEEDVIRQRDLEAAILRLPARYQELLRLRYYTDLDWNEVAEVLGISSANARKLHERAVKILRTVLAPVSNPESRRVPE